jgi:hypothetical protein
MAKINDTSSYATSSPIVGDDIAIGSAGGSGGDTKNFAMSDILAYIMSSSTLSLQDVCDNGSTTTTGISVGGTLGVTGATTLGSTLEVTGASTLDIVSVTNNATVGGTLGVTGATTLSNGATINGAGLAVNGSGGIVVTDVAGITSAGGPVSGTALSTSGGLLVSGTSLLGEIDSAGPADIADTLTLSKATGTGLQVDADAVVDGTLSVATTFKATPSSVNISVTKPSSSSSSGDAGDIAFDSSYIYVCIGTNSWGRVAIDTTPF